MKSAENNLERTDSMQGMMGELDGREPKYSQEDGGRII
jgi:hypothetical protein